MKKPTLTLLTLLALTLTGCVKTLRSQSNVVFYNKYWDILRLNDSTLLIVPDGTDTVPMIKHITHGSDCPCREKGEAQ